MILPPVEKIEHTWCHPFRRDWRLDRLRRFIPADLQSDRQVGAKGYIV
jgi:hypothetical protein